MRPKPSIAVAAALALLVAASAGVETQEPNRASPSAQASVSGAQPLLDRYCLTCHNERVKAGGLVLAPFDAERAVRDAPTGE